MKRALHFPGLSSLLYSKKEKQQQKPRNYLSTFIHLKPNVLLIWLSFPRWYSFEYNIFQMDLERTQDTQRSTESDLNCR